MSRFCLQSSRKPSENFLYSIAVVCSVAIGIPKKGPYLGRSRRQMTRLDALPALWIWGRSDELRLAPRIKHPTLVFIEIGPGGFDGHRRPWGVQTAAAPRLSATRETGTRSLSNAATSIATHEPE